MYCSLFITELAHSMQSLTARAMDELQLYSDAEKALISSSSTNGTAILRVLQSLSSLVTTLQDKKDPLLHPEKDFSDALSKVWDINSALESLWLELSNCIGKIESSSESPSDIVSTAANAGPSNAGVAPPLPAGTQNILPYIESFFVTCEKLHPGQSEAVQDYTPSTPSDIEEASTSSGGGPKSTSGSHFHVDEKHGAS
uniref:Uncharacterized protein n=1 Tax=Ananas comosus var. bracteatus TaxID=296719 RepID=A0A6V7P0T9_ANACO|nr:unnamed protein product [Ananas comosus var. bracteatus]